MSESLLIAILGGNTTLLVAVIGFLGVYIRRNGTKPEAWNGNERRQGEMARHEQRLGELAQHINTCPNMVKLEKTIDNLGTQVAKLREDVNLRIDTLIQQERR